MALAVSLLIAADAGMLSAAGEGLVAMNRVLLARDPRRYALSPLDRRMGLRYRREPRDESGHRRDWWQTADMVQEQGYGDCEDLAAYLVAWLQVRGVDARFMVTPNASGSFHALSWVAGRVVDPSKVLILRERGT